MRFVVRVAAVACAIAAPWTADAAPATADTARCVGLRDPAARKSCLAQERRAYGQRLEQSFADQGQDARVFVQEAGEPESGAYPRLVVWAFLTLDEMRQLNAQQRIVDNARRTGFRMLVYVDKGETSNWYFDLTKPGVAPMDVVISPLPPWKRKP